MSEKKIAIGVSQLNNGMFRAELGMRNLGEFKTHKEAATEYNTYINKIFNFPLYNRIGEIPIKEEDPEPIVIEEVKKELPKKIEIIPEEQPPIPEEPYE